VKCLSAAKVLVAMGLGSDILLLDNLAPKAVPHPELDAAAVQVKAAHPEVTVEASGGIFLGTFPRFLEPHIDVVSMGCLTHRSPNLDFALWV
ncbi:NADC pyrophosphorylase, partial [Sylvietta virens]|nr:NADC pyrophosphorylase [Sylvietta virens]